MFSFAYNSLPFLHEVGPVTEQEDINNKRRELKDNLGYTKYSSNGYSTNNRYPTFPPLMNDSRSLISSWNTETQWNATLISKNNINTNSKYRQFLQENAERIMKDQYLASSNDTGTFLEHAYKSENTGSNTIRGAVNSIPYHFASYLSADKPPGYSESDLKASFLQKERVNSCKFRPTLQP